MRRYSLVLLGLILSTGSHLVLAQPATDSVLVSKSEALQFTATAILQLAEAGKLSVDDPVSKYYSDAPPAWHGITIRHLLTHTSGIPSYTTRDNPLEFEPDSKNSYDNGGYVRRPVGQHAVEVLDALYRSAASGRIERV
jgi:Beta-lactamase